MKRGTTGDSPFKDGSRITRITRIKEGGAGTDPNLIAELERMYGFDKPPHERFFQMITRYARFDFGESFYRDQTVVEMVLESAGTRTIG